MTTVSGSVEMVTANSDDRLLRDGDLVDDRELRRVDQDRFEHRRIAAQLVELATTVEDPANIALYGPWGSGKTGIANLMRSGLKAHAGVRFARFDAFKYAENPLRRKFVSAIASELNIKGRRYHDDLYSGRTRTDVQIPRANLFKVFAMFVGLIVVIAGVLAAVIALIAWAQTGGFKGNFKTLWAPVAVAGLLPAALLSALVALVGKSLQVERSLAKPDSDEQFESLLADLVKDSGARRVVIFVDELDRCSAKDVVATLDAVRTFLGVGKCIFVVAADQQVLEQALSDGSEQSTPADVRNPYYSTGSAFLDKVFQYQVALPDLLPPNVTEFAVSLVKERETGVWTELPRRDFVISVLIPSHVTSPRRVKHLMNTFALTYRLAEDRHRSGDLAVSPKDAAAAIAKLVCLRVEFPLFARDLAVDERLPDLVLAAVDRRTMEAASDEVEDLVVRHAELAAQTTLIIGDGDDRADDDPDIKAVKAQQHRQFLNYLRRTATVPGLSRDLIYMKSEAAISGLPTSQAQALSAAAEDADAGVVARNLTRDAVSEEERRKALEYLVSRMHHAVGVEAENIAVTLLLLAARNPELQIEEFADDIVTTVGGMLNGGSEILTDSTTPGAWSLALAAGYDTSKFRCDVIQHIADHHDYDGLYLLSDADAVAVNREGVNRVVARVLVSEDYERAVRALDALSPQQRTAALDLCSDVPVAIKTALSEHAHFEEELRETATTADTPAVTGSAAARATPTVDEEETEEPFDPKPLLAEFARKAAEWVQVDAACGYAALRFLLAVDHAEARNAVEPVLEEFPPTNDPFIASSLLRAAALRGLASWRRWLARVEPGPLSTVPVVVWSDLAARLWSSVKAAKGAPTRAVVAEAAGLLATLTEPIAKPPRLTSEAVAVVSSLVESDSEARPRLALLHRIDELIRHGFVDEDTLNGSLVQTLAETVEAGVVAGDIGGDLIGYVQEFARPAFEQQVAAHGVTPACAALLSALAADDTWLAEPMRFELFVALLAAAHSHGAADEALIPDAETITAFLKSHGSGAAACLRTWLMLAVPAYSEARPLLDDVVGLRALDDKTAEAFRALVAGWPDGDRLELVAHHIRKSGAGIPPTLLRDAIGLADAPEDGVANILIARYKNSTNNASRVAVLDLWAAAGISDESVRARMYSEVATPMVALRQPGGTKPNSEAVKAVLAHLKALDAPPPAVKKSFDAALGTAIDGDEDLEKTASRRLKEIGYRTKKSRNPFSSRETPEFG